VKPAGGPGPAASEGVGRTGRAGRRRWPVLRTLCATPRLFIAAALALAVGLLLPSAVTTHLATRFLIAFNADSGLCVLLAAVMMQRS